MWVEFWQREVDLTKTVSDVMYDLLEVLSRILCPKPL